MYKPSFAPGGIFMLAGKEKIKVAGGIPFAMLLGLIITVLMLLGAALLFSTGKISYSTAPEIITGINFAGAAITGALAAGLRGKEAVATGLIVGTTFMVLLLLVGLAFGGGRLSGSEAIRIAICSLCGGLFGGVLCIRRGNKKLHKKHVKKR